MQDNQGRIILYANESGNVSVDVYFAEETFWLTQAGMAELFRTTKQNISLHLQNCFKTEELEENAVVKEILTTAADGIVEHSRLDDNSLPRRESPLHRVWIQQSCCVRSNDQPVAEKTKVFLVP